jgi:predicted porin
VTFGRQYGPALLAHIGTEPRAFKEQFSNLYAWAYNQYQATAGAPGTDRNTNNDVGIFFSNAIQYRNTVGPFSFGVLWSPAASRAAPRRTAPGRWAPPIPAR